MTDLEFLTMLVLVVVTVAAGAVLNCWIEDRREAARHRRQANKSPTSPLCAWYNPLRQFLAVGQSSVVTTTSSSTTTPIPSLRIACLQPSATAICLALGLQHHIVGVTHECAALLKDKVDWNHVRILTKDGLAHVTLQGDIHQAVCQASQQAATSCEPHRRLGPTQISIDNVPSLYPLIPEQLRASRPTVIFTQDLCAVCAPTVQDVQNVVWSASASHDAAAVAIQIVSLQPQTLYQVAETFVTIAATCGIAEQGRALANSWLAKLAQLQAAVESSARNPHVPRVLLLEWLDPTFDGGHWTVEMMDFASVQRVGHIVDDDNSSNRKAQAVEWPTIYDWDPDVIVVGCCGFDLSRNVRDVQRHAKQLQPLRAVQNDRLYACHGNLYTAMPAPTLLQGTVLLAKCAYADQPTILQAIDALQFFPDIVVGEMESEAWQKVSLVKRTDEDAIPPAIVDMEDLASPSEGFAQVHQEACRQGQLSYNDPETGYSVFTEVAHKQRGWCCGSGCRHCPYSHQNVKDKAARIQQPAILVQQKTSDEGNDELFALDHDHIKVLFFSGGKDSFLTIRSLVRQYYQQQQPRFGLVLLTTFDASTRNIAHQNVPIDQVMQQASHLNITLLGIPLRRASGEAYKDRIKRGLDVIQNSLGPKSTLSALVFGDLHLDHIKDWRDQTFADLGYQLEYPLWKKDYAALMDDLEASQVPCFLSASTVDTVSVGTPFTRELYDRAPSLDLDRFGERGEFHSIAQVWQVPRYVALGLKPLVDKE